MGDHVIEHGSSRSGRWLRERRLRIGLWIAVAEGLLVALQHTSRWAVIGFAIVMIAVYLGVGRTARSDVVRQILWIIAFSQALAVIVVIVAFILKWVAILLAVAFAAVAILFLLTDRR